MLSLTHNIIFYNILQFKSSFWLINFVFNILFMCITADIF